MENINFIIIVYRNRHVGFSLTHAVAAVHLCWTLEHESPELPRRAELLSATFHTEIFTFKCLQLYIFSIFVSSVSELNVAAEHFSELTVAFKVKKRLGTSALVS